MQGDKSRVVAEAAGFVSIFGNIFKGAGDTINLPEGMCNIGGNGFGYLLASQASWNPLTAGNNDGSFAALALGDDIYIYACRHSSGTARWLASKNSTVPTGYDADTSRKMGGFHVGRYRGVANRYSTSYVPVVQILPGSCWDVGHRPTCDPTGMVEVIPGSMWADIYMASVGSGVWPSIVPVSKYGATLIRDNTYARVDLHQIINNAGKRLPTPEEFLRYAEGAPGGLDGSNDQAWSMTTNTGSTTAGGVAKAVSQYDVVDAAGNLYEWLDSNYDRGDYNGSVTPFAWDAAVVNVGPDSAIPRGYVQHAGWQAFVGGGGWYAGVHCGARCLASVASPWNALGNVGLRGVCDSL